MDINENYQFTISIIIPFYNALDKINFFLNSLIKQDLNAVEIIFVDDGSIDGTSELIETILSAENITYKIIRKHNGGVSSARNLGLNKAIGTYVIFVDSDDALLNDAISEIKKSVHDNKEANFFIFEYLRFKEVNKNDALKYTIADKEYVNIEASEIFKRYLSGVLIKRISVCSCVYKLEFLRDKKIQFDENYSYGEDQKFVIDCLTSSSDFKYFKFPILAYVNYDNSATGIYNPKWFHSYQVFSSIYQRAELSCYKNELENRMNNELLAIANKIIMQNNFFESLMFIRKNILPLRHRIHKLASFVLFEIPFLYVFLYRSYKFFR